MLTPVGWTVSLTRSFFLPHYSSAVKFQDSVCQSGGTFCTFAAQWDHQQEKNVLKPWTTAGVCPVQADCTARTADSVTASRVRAAIPAYTRRMGSQRHHPEASAVTAAELQRDAGTSMERSWREESILWRQRAASIHAALTLPSTSISRTFLLSTFSDNLAAHSCWKALKGASHSMRHAQRLPSGTDLRMFSHFTLRLFYGIYYSTLTPL